MPRLFIFILVFLKVCTIDAQPLVVKGAVKDSVSGRMLINATVVCLTPKDSLMLRYARTNEKGEFELRINSLDSFVLTIYYPEYTVFSDLIRSNKRAEVLGLGTIVLFSKIHVLQEVVVKQTLGSIRFKGDTTEFMADSFKVRPGDNVENLLKRLPGFIIDRNGNIAVRGQRIGIVLVDGEEFFGNDPTMATRNLNASDVAKIQLFERSSSASTITGMQDNTKQSAVNIVLKDDAKRGYFGKVEYGSDLDKYQGKFTGNRFSSTSKKGFYFSGDRTGGAKMTFSEGQDFGNTILSFDGNNVKISTLNDEYNSLESEGIPENLAAATMFNQKYGSIENLNNTVNNISYNKMSLYGELNKHSEYYLRDQKYYNDQHDQYMTEKFRWVVNSKNDINLNDRNSLSVNVKGEWSGNIEKSSLKGHFEDQRHQLLSDYTKSVNSNSTNDRQRYETFWRHKFKKQNRLLAVGIAGEFSASLGDGLLLNRIQYYSVGVPTVSQVLDQYKSNRNTASGFQTIISLTEPLSKKLLFNINHTFSYSIADQKFQTFNRKLGQLDSIDQAFSSDFHYAEVVHKSSPTLSYSAQKITSRLGVNAQILSTQQVNNFDKSIYSRTFYSILPNFNFRFKWNKSRNTVLSYQSFFQQPSFSQLQNFQNNADPQNIMLGNPQLKPQFSHIFSANYNEYFPKSEWNLYIAISSTIYRNAFSFNYQVDSNGFRSSMPINVVGNNIFSLGLGISKEFKKHSAMIDFSPRYRSFTFHNIANGEPYVTVVRTLSLGTKYDRKLSSKIDGYLWYEPEFNHSETKNTTGLPVYYISHFLEAKLNIDFGDYLNFNTKISSDIRPSGNSVFNGTSVTIWNASVEKRIVKKSDLSVIIAINDILNNRRGISRSINSNFLSERTFNAVQRFYLLTFRWRFSKNRTISKND